MEHPESRNGLVLKETAPASAHFPFAFSRSPLQLPPFPVLFLRWIVFGHWALRRAARAWKSEPPYECLFIKAPALPQEQAFNSTVLSWAATRGLNMRKLTLALAALATIAVAAPTIATAEDFGVGVRVGGDQFRDRGEFRGREEFRGARAEFRDHDRGWHRGWDRDRSDRTVIIKRRHHDWD
jgi:hypothetical protein